MGGTLKLPKAELAVMKAEFGDTLPTVLAEVVTAFVRHAKAQAVNRPRYSQVSKTYPRGNLRIRLETSVADDHGIHCVWLTLSGLRGSSTFDLDEFITKGEHLLIEETLLKEEETETDRKG
jgi:hypothetical protein